MTHSKGSGWSRAIATQEPVFRRATASIGEGERTATGPAAIKP